MVNKLNNYRNGAARERRFVNNLKKDGFDIVFRSAGSHSPVDVVAIHQESKMIYFIQCKPQTLSKNAQKALQSHYEWLNRDYACHFKVASLYSDLVGGSK